MNGDGGGPAIEANNDQLKKQMLKTKIKLNEEGRGVEGGWNSREERALHRSPETSGGAAVIARDTSLQPSVAALKAGTDLEARQEALARTG